MKKIIVSALVIAIVMSLAAVSVSAETVELDEGELIFRLFDPESETVEPWLANTSDALSISEIDGRRVLTHATWDSSWSTSLSIKRYYEVDWENYEYDKVMLVADLYVGGTLPFDFDVSGEFKIKHGDSADANGNTTDMNQFYTPVWEMELTEGWNHIELPIAEMYNSDGNNELFKTTDWFCLWMKGSGYVFDISIGRLDIVATSETLVTEPPETDPPETDEELTVTEPEDDGADAATDAATEPGGGTPADTSPETEPKDEGGCGSTAAGSAALAVITAALGAAVIKRRGQDKDKDKDK